jgi:transcriptional regulator
MATERPSKGEVSGERDDPDGRATGDMLQGTLDMLILQTLILGPAHGHAIAHAIERRSDQILQVEHGSLYPALYRLEARGWIASFWGTSENNRKARYYRLSAVGRKQLAAETSRWERLVNGISRVLRPAEE